MDKNKEMLQLLLNRKAFAQIKLESLNYEGNVEVRSIDNENYIYLRKRVAGRNEAILVDKYNDELFFTLKNKQVEYKNLSIEIKKIDNELKILGLLDKNLPSNVISTLDYLKKNYENILCNFLLLENITLNNRTIKEVISKQNYRGVRFSDRTKVLSIIKVFEYITDKYQLLMPTNYFALKFINQILQEGFYNDDISDFSSKDKLKSHSYIENEEKIVRDIERLVQSIEPPIEVSIKLFCYCIKLESYSYISIILFINLYLISKGEGLICIPRNEINTFKRNIIDFKTNNNSKNLSSFLKSVCWKKQ